MSKEFAQALTDKQLLILKPFVYKLQKDPDFIKQVFPELAVTLQDNSRAELYRAVSEEIVRRNLTTLDADPELAKAMGSKEVTFEVYED